MNRKLIFPLALLFILLFAVQTYAWWWETKPSQLVKKIQPAVVTIVTYDKHNKCLGQGSGFFVDNKGHIVTNYHVLKGAYSAKVKTYDGIEYSIKSVVAENKTMDLVKVLAHVPHKTYMGIQVIEDQPAIAERILVVGSPMGLEQTVSEGIVSGFREIPNVGRILQISAPISSGSSGSPVVNMKGKVIGVASFYLTKGQNLNFAVPGKYVLDLEEEETGKPITKWTGAVNKKTMAASLNTKITLDLTNADIRNFCRLLEDVTGVNIVPDQRVKGVLTINIKSATVKHVLSLIAEEYKLDIVKDKERNLIEIKPPIATNKEYYIASTARDYSVRGCYYQNRFEYGKAVADYKRAIELEPNDSLPYYNMAIIKEYHGEKAEALECYKKSCCLGYKEGCDKYCEIHGPFTWYDERGTFHAVACLDPCQKEKRGKESGIVFEALLKEAEEDVIAIDLVKKRFAKQLSELDNEAHFWMIQKAQEQIYLVGYMNYVIGSKEIGRFFEVNLAKNTVIFVEMETGLIRKYGLRDRDRHIFTAEELLHYGEQLAGWWRLLEKRGGIRMQLLAKERE